MLPADLLPVTVPAVPWSDVAAKLTPYIAQRVPPADVEDVLQDVMLRMYRGVSSLREEDRMTSWMYQVARNAITDRARDRARHPLRAADEIEAESSTEDERAAATSLAQCLTIFVARLPSPYREAVTLVELEGMTIRAAAAMTATSVSAMKSRVQRGRARLRQLLEECCEIAVDVRGAVTDVSPRPAACAAGCSCSKPEHAGS